MSKAKLLVVDDDPLILSSLAELLRDEGYDVKTCSCGLDALRVVKSEPIDLVLSDVNMPDIDGLQLLREVKAQVPDCEFVLMTGFGSIENAVEAMGIGAYHYITKPLIDEEIKLLLDRALEQRRLRSENEYLKKELNIKFSFDNIIGRDHKMMDIFNTIEQIASTRATVIILGESGTGKTLIARAIHHNSDRRNRRLIEVNCGALPENLLESELFGHTKGSFTGALKDKVGKFELADKGSIFLDEIANSSSALQVKLLRVIQDKELEKIGSHDTVRVDARIILATNSDLWEEVEKGSFREDLYYRIKVVTIDLPPLRERMSDLKPLAEFFLDKYCRENNRNFEKFDDDAIQLMQEYSWPGNIRQLENAVERAVVLAKSDSTVITPMDLPPEVSEEVPRFVAEETSNGEILPLKEALKNPEKRIIEAALRANKWNRQKTAAMLEVNRTTLFNKMKKYGLLAE